MLSWHGEVVKSSPCVHGVIGSNRRCDIWFISTFCQRSLGNHHFSFGTHAFGRKLAVLLRDDHALMGKSQIQWSRSSNLESPLITACLTDSQFLDSFPVSYTVMSMLSLLSCVHPVLDNPDLFYQEPRPPSLFSPGLCDV